MCGVTRRFFNSLIHKIMNQEIALQNRNEAFFKKIDDFSLRRKTVYKLIEQYGQLTTQEIKQKMVLGVNQVSGRVSELAQLFFIKPSGSKMNKKTKLPNTIWKVTTPSERTDLINKKFIELRSERDDLVNDLNLNDLSTYLKKYSLKRIAKIDVLISNLETF